MKPDSRCIFSIWERQCKTGHIRTGDGWMDGHKYWIFHGRFLYETKIFKDYKNVIFGFSLLGTTLVVVPVDTTIFLRFLIKERCGTSWKRGHCQQTILSISKSSVKNQNKLKTLRLLLQTNYCCHMKMCN